MNVSLGKRKLIKHHISNQNIDSFKFLLQNLKWGRILHVNSPNRVHESFHFTFADFFYTTFLKRAIEIKIQHLLCPL